MNSTMNSIGGRLAALMTGMVAIIAIVGGSGLLGVVDLKAMIHQTIHSLNDTSRLAEIRTLLGENRTQSLLVLMHDPANPMSKLHNEPVDDNFSTIAGNRDRLGQLLGQARQDAASAETTQALDAFAAAVDGYNAALAAEEAAVRSGDYESANHIHLEKVSPGYRTALDDIRSLERIDAHNAAGLETAAVSEASNKVTVIAASVALGCLAAGAFGFMLGRSVSVPLSNVARLASHAVERDDFTATLPVPAIREAGQVAAAFNAMMDKLRHVIGEAGSSAGRIGDASSGLAQAAQQVAASSSRQSEATSSVAAAIEQISVSLSETAANTRQSEEVAKQSRRDSEQALLVTRNTMTDMAAIADSIRVSTEDVLRLSESSKQISGIVGVIKEIADQTNLLALNAAIEAARAGEQGRGFSVVADEVRQLAERTADSTREIGALIESIQGQVGHTVEAMQSADRQAAHSVTMAREAETVLGQIVRGSEEVVQRVEEIASAIQEQDTAVHDIAVNVERIAQMTEENNAAARHNGELAETLDGLSGTLRESIGRYRI
jgi:methyl-accepting chemotaxis protein